MNKRLIIFFVLTFFVLFYGLTGIDWGVPNSARTKKILSPDWDLKKLFSELATSWEEIYKKSADTTPLIAEKIGKYTTHIKGIIKIKFEDKNIPIELYNSYRSLIIRSRYPDEAPILAALAQMKPQELKFKPPSYVYGGGYLYPLGVYYFILTKIGIIKKLSLQQYMENPDQLGKVYVAGRILSVICYFGICLVCFFISKNIFNFASGVLSFIFLMICPIIIIYSHSFGVHLWSTLWGLLSILFLIKCFRNPSVRNFILSAIFTGISIASYWAQIHILIFWFFLFVFLKKNNFKKFFLAGSVIIFVFFMFNPYLIFDWKVFLEEMEGSGFLSFRYPTINSLKGSFLNAIPEVIGIGFTITMLCSYIWGLRNKNVIIRFLTIPCLIIAFFSYIIITPDLPSAARRILPWLIVNLLLGSLFVYNLFLFFKKWIWIILVVIIILPSFLLSTAYIVNFKKESSFNSTFVKMGSFLDSIQPKGSLGFLIFPQPVFTPHFRFDRWNLILLDIPSFLNSKDLPYYLLVDFERKIYIKDILKKRYILYRGFYPHKLFKIIKINPYVSAVNAPIELYKLKE